MKPRCPPGFFDRFLERGDAPNRHPKHLEEFSIEQLGLALLVPVILPSRSEARRANSDLVERESHYTVPGLEMNSIIETLPCDSKLRCARRIGLGSQPSDSARVRVALSANASLPRCRVTLPTGPTDSHVTSRRPGSRRLCSGPD